MKAPSFPFKKNSRLVVMASISFITACHSIQPGPITFKDYSKQSDLYELAKGFNAHSVAAGDVNNDGYTDIFIGNFANHVGSDYNHRGHPAFPEPDILLLNNQGKGFTKVENSPVAITSVSSGSAFADFDNDGLLDFVSGHLSFYGNQGKKVMHAGQKNYLFKNTGNGQMIDVTKNSGLDFNTDSVSTARNTFVLDYDGDGMLDIIMQDDDVWEWSVGKSKLMRNKGDMKFEDVTTKAGFPSHFYGLGGFVGDVNGDSWPDVFFAHSTELYINNTDGTFRKSKQQFIDEKKKEPFRKGNTLWTCGANTGDLNGDGLIDFVVGEHFHKDSVHRIYVFLNKGNDNFNNPIFENVTDKVGIRNATSKQPHVEVEDLDNDGDMDILISSRDNFFYTNTGKDENGLPIFKGPGKSNAPTDGLDYWPAGTLFDFDRDGKLDFVAPQWYAYETSPLLKNITKGANNYITLKLDIASEKNRNGVGATIKLYKPGNANMPESLIGTKVISVSNGYSAGSTSEAHFGTPGLKMVDVIVEMPCEGAKYKLSNLNTRNYLVINDELIKEKGVKIN